MTAYPPEPWYLGGSMLVSVFLVPVRDLPAGVLSALPDGRRPLRIGGRAIVGVAFANYTPGGALAYDELLVALPSLQRGRLRVTIPQIWVDSPASLAGGRELWGIPKELAEFERDDSHVSMSLGSPVATLASQRGPRLLPGMPQLALPILQGLGGHGVLSNNRVIGRIFGLRTLWAFARSGPLGYLAGRKPLISVAIRDASIIFGMDVAR